ncbi:MAG: glycerol-3-phosphate dehydrogenase [Pseudomonadota bacterium]
MTAESSEHYDVFIIGGGINGAGIARDAVGRGYSVCLCEAGDFAGGTSSASTKLFHGGLRYLEYFEVRLVREALIEREVLLRAMPHISWPMRFVLPYHPDMRFEGQSPTSKLLSFTMPWLKGSRPAWLIRFGLFLYDNLGGRKILPGTKTLDLRKDEAGRSLKPHFSKAFEYSDCWIDDARLVVLNLMDAAKRGADINRSTRVDRATFQDGKWHVDATNTRTGETKSVTASLIINAAGPWVDEVLKQVFGMNEASNVRLVRGSHIVVAKKFDHDRCYFFQNADGRIIFAIPYEGDYTLIGTTDADHSLEDGKPKISDEERAYLCRMASEYFKEPVSEDDIVWTYSGVRPLFDDGASAAQSATRDYVLKPVPSMGNDSLINIFGGKITTYRKLAESMLELITERLGERGKPWTGGPALPGGDMAVDAVSDQVAILQSAFPFLPAGMAQRLMRTYGTLAHDILGSAHDLDALGQHFGADLYEAEVRYLFENEWVESAQDVLYRRTKIGLRLSDNQANALQSWIEGQLARG